MTLQQLLLILRARYPVVLLVFLVSVVGTAVVSLLLPKQYTASAVVVLDVRSPDPVTGQMLQGMMTPGYMATQVDIINSDRVATAVVRLLKLDDDPDTQARWMAGAGGKGQLADWLANGLQKNLSVLPSRDSNVIQVNYTSADPEQAATLANAFARAYINVNLDLRLAPARQYAAFFDEQTKAARARLDATQKALSDYQQQNGITATDESLDFETAKLNETSSQLTAIQGQTTDSQSKRQSSQTDTVAEVMQSSLINGLKADVARLEAKLTESSGNLGKNHPQTQRSEAELATLKAQLNLETRRITNSIETSYQVSRQREAQLQGALAGQKNRVLLLNKQRDELNVLRRDMESAQRAFEVVSQRAAQTNLESQTNQTNIAVLNPAFAPSDPSKPKLLLNMLLSILMGGLLGLGLALVLEMAQRRVRSTADLTDALGLPVLGSIAPTGARA
ncbi:chain length determinant protein EpsF [Rhodoferax sp. U2-2l]|uniref:chain length determinant protein EpsF n=1 Tax=Rhodoferax sp. U2-2l TaxID=2884000 RepID=UPI001D0B41CC|nr:chain length determinant protein EpsF [Rhodoferax sp. U2-2l]MCB8746904.1 chain length determinant protein EpsF [Rhodoferax sp. U2-2l]